MRENIRIYRGFHETKVGNSTVIINGKKVKGDWYYGCLLRDNVSGIYAIVTYVNLGGNIQDLSEINIFSVLPETVGQDTGLTDKNGKKIFEGDILKGYLDDEFPQNCTIALVVWFGFGWFTKERNCCPDPLEKNDGKVFEVIGSIYENPELIEGEGKNESL